MGIFSRLTKLTSGYKLWAVLWPRAVRLKTDFRPVVGFMFARVLDDSRLRAFHQGFQSWLSGEGWWMWQQTECRPPPLPSELLVALLAPVTARSTQSALAVCSPLGPGNSLHLLKYWVRPVCFTFFNEILQCHPGHCFFTLSSQTHPVWQKTPWLTRCQSSLWTKSALVLIFILVWNLTSAELLWSCSSIIESGIRHQSPLYSPGWGELSYQCEHLNVNEAAEMEFCSQGLQWNAFTSI